jgi:hypothetical protein
MTKSVDMALQGLTSRFHEQALQMATLENTVNVQFQLIANMKSSEGDSRESS